MLLSILVLFISVVIHRGIDFSLFFVCHQPTTTIAGVQVRIHESLPNSKLKRPCSLRNASRYAMTMSQHCNMHVSESVQISFAKFTPPLNIIHKLAGSYKIY